MSIFLIRHSAPIQSSFEKNSDSLKIVTKNDSYKIETFPTPNEYNLKIIKVFRRSFIFSSSVGTFIHCFTWPGQYEIKVVEDHKRMKLQIKQIIDPEQVWYEWPIPDFSKN